MGDDGQPAASDDGRPGTTLDERLLRAYDEGALAAERGEEAAPGCTTTPEGRAWLRGYVDSAKARRDAETT